MGGSTRQPIMTAYRQQALACAAALSHAPARPRDFKGAVPDAPKILLRNVYGWFVRVERGLYALSEAGSAALVRWKGHLPADDRASSWRAGRIMSPRTALADLPQAPSRSQVLSLGARRPPLHVHIVAAARPRHVGRSREPHQCLRALLHAARHRPQDVMARSIRMPLLRLKPLATNPGMETVRRHAAALETARQLDREQDVGQLVFL